MLGQVGEGPVPAWADAVLDPLRHPIVAASMVVGPGALIDDLGLLSYDALLEPPDALPLLGVPLKCRHCPQCG